MGDVFKVLDQKDPVGGILTDSYVTPGATSAIVSTLTVCNRNPFEIRYRIAVAVAGAADDPKQYRYYDTPLGANDSYVATVGWSLAATDRIRVQSDRGGVSFNFDGMENT